MYVGCRTNEGFTYIIQDVLTYSLSWLIVLSSVMENEVSELMGFLNVNSDELFKIFSTLSSNIGVQNT